MYLRLLVAVLLTFGISRAQDSENGQIFTLEECINIALENNSALKQKGYENETAENNALGSYSGYLPSLNLSLNSGQARQGATQRQAAPDEISGFDPVTGEAVYGGTITIPGSKRDFNNLSLSLSQTIFDGERLANIFQAGSREESAGFDLEDQENYTVLTVKQAYFNLIKQLKLEEANKVAVERSQSQVNRTQKMFDLGAAAKLDLYQAKVNLGNDKISLLNQQNLVDDAKRSLNLAMAREPESDINIQLLEVFQFKDFSLDEMYETAMDNRPLIKMGEAEIESSEYGVLRSKANYLPRLSFFYNYNRSNSDFGKVYSDFNLNWGTNYGVALSMNLFNGFEDYLNVQNAKINESQVRETHAENIRNLKSRIRGYYENYRSYMEIIEINKENLEAAKEELRLAEERYQIGAGTSLEVREAQVKLTSAEQTLIAAQYNALITEAQLDNELGITAKKLDE